MPVRPIRKQLVKVYSDDPIVRYTIHTVDGILQKAVHEGRLSPKTYERIIRILKREMDSGRGKDSKADKGND